MVGAFYYKNEKMVGVRFKGRFDLCGYIEKRVDPYLLLVLLLCWV